MSNKEINDPIEILTELEGDVTVPKNVRSIIKSIIKNLKEEAEISTKVSKALNDLDEIADDVNLQAYTRTQIWNVVSLLEKINKEG
ncbi:UPF0147 family protein [Candidatus Woesearchaeota archaeon]|nr:UPF0147 family protein [Candidatus Woesearchaeota archaeon]